MKFHKHYIRKNVDNEITLLPNIMNMI